MAQSYVYSFCLYQIEGFDEFAIDPANKNALLGDLPQPLKGRVLENGYVCSPVINSNDIALFLLREAI